MRKVSPLSSSLVTCVLNMSAFLCQTNCFQDGYVNGSDDIYKANPFVYVAGAGTVPLAALQEGVNRQI